MINYQTVVFNGSGVLAVGFPNVPIIFCGVVGPFVAVLISVGVTASANVPTIINIPSVYPPELAPLLLLTSSAVLVVSCAAVGLVLLRSYHCCFVLGVFAMARVSYVAAIITAVEVSSATGVSKVPGVPTVVGAPDVVSVLAVVSCLLLLGLCC